MIATKINDNKYEVEFYDWLNKHDDYIVGFIKRDPSADEESDERYWLFYPNGDKTAINAGELRRLSKFIAELNTE